MSIKICHASIDERGQGRNGQSGDQTGKEVCVRDYYKKNWTTVIRHPDPSIRKKAAKIAKKLANSNLVGYDMNQRNTLYSALKKFNFDADMYIASGIKTETDCSAFIYAIYSCVLPELRRDTNAPTTADMKSFYERYGFQISVDSVFNSDPSNFKIGDILVIYDASAHHTVIVVDVDTNTKTEGDANSVDKPKTTKVEYYKKCASGYTSIVDALKSIGEKDSSLKHREKIAKANSIPTTNNFEMNRKLLVILKSGKLIKA